MRELPVYAESGNGVRWLGREFELPTVRLIDLDRLGLVTERGVDIWTLKSVII